MYYSDFDSFIQLFVAFDFALVVSPLFTIIYDFFLIPYSGIKETIDSLDNKVKFYIISFEGFQTQIATIVKDYNSEQLEIFQRNIANIQNSLVNILARTDILKYKSALPSNFSALCLFSGLYGIGLLFFPHLPGITSHSLLFHESVLVFDLLYILLIITAFLKDLLRILKGLSFRKLNLTMLFLFFLVICILYYSILKKPIFPMFLSPEMDAKALDSIFSRYSNIIVWFSCLLLILHYLFYFSRTFIVFLFHYRKIVTSIRIVEGNMKEFEGNDLKKMAGVIEIVFPNSISHN